MSRSDPISETYFRPLERAESASVAIAAGAAAVSVWILFIDRGQHAGRYEWVQVLYGLLVVASWAVSLAIKLYWAPRAGDKRVADFLSTAFGVNLTHERTDGYYNNAATTPVRKASLQVLENAYFTKDLARLMCKRRRMWALGYVALWLIIVTVRQTPIDLVLIAIQILFAGEILTGWARVEWLRSRSEQLFERLYRELNGSRGEERRELALFVDEFTRYEAAKAAAAITIPSALFRENNARLSAAWEGIRRSLEA